MGRTKGAKNKRPATDPMLLLSESQRVDLIANLILEIILDEHQVGAEVVDL